MTLITGFIAAASLLLCQAGATPPQDVPPATPPVLAPFGTFSEATTTEEWQARVPALREAFAAQIYGRLPQELSAYEISRHDIPATNISGASAAGEVLLADPVLGRRFTVAYVLPQGEGPFPSVMQLSFCGNALALGSLEGVSPPLSGAPGFCNRFIDAPAPEGTDPYLLAMPVEELLAAGIAVVSVFPGDVIPDDKEAALPLLDKLSPTDDLKTRPGAIAAWGWVASLAVTVLESDARFDNQKMAVMGHSRNGKAAFAAMLFDPRIDLLWAHQSGTGGATLNRSYEGEAIENITGGFPHWFAPAYRDYAGREEDLPVDQHMAIAAMAPRPVLLGGAWDDRWAGPMGAYAAAQGADPVYELFGVDGFDQTGPEDMNPQADLSVFIRDGTHGTKLSDWRKFITFAKHHFGLED